MTFDSTGSTFYFETGNGSATGALTLNAQGFPATGNYYEAVVRMTVDPTTTASSMGMNGWGLKVVDYFVPYNQPALDQADEDFGSGSPLLLPASAGVAGHPNLLIAAGKQGVIYVVDRDNMGKFDPTQDHVVNAVQNSSGVITPPVAVGGLLSTPVFYNNTLYVAAGYQAPSKSFTLNSLGQLVVASQTTAQSFGYLPGSPILSANGNVGGIIWQTDRATNELHAFDANTYNTELWNSAQKPNNADAVGTVLKLTTPTVANGEVFVGTINSLVIYGLTPPAASVPNAPVLAASDLSGTSIRLNWTDSTTAPNTATSYSIEELVSGSWVAVTTAPGTSTTVDIGGLSPLTGYSFRIHGLNGTGYSNYSNIATVTTTNLVATINLSNGFNGSNSQLTYNGNAVIVGSAAQLTDSNAAGNEAGSVFSNTRLDITKFSTTFNFRVTAGTSIADGFTFTIQGNSPTALGSFGQALGYGASGLNTGQITNSIAVKFDLYSNSGEGVDSTGLYLNGSTPTTPSVDMTSSGVNLHSGDTMQATLAYDGTTLTETLVDTVTGKSFLTSYAVNVPAATGSTAYVGFTAGTGGQVATQDILSWSFAPNAPAAPAAPSGLGVTPASGSSVNVSWTNNATNQTGFSLDRATDAAFSQNLVTQILPATPTSFVDTYLGLASGGTWYYRIRATNTAGSSASSPTASVFIPFVPAKPTNFTVVSATTTSLAITWTDNASVTADGYHVLRAVNHGAFALYATLPQEANAAPSTYEWSDTGLTPGTFYDYHVQAFNIAGYNDFSGGSATTITAVPTTLAANASSGSITLNWNAPAGATAYNVYRGTTAGGESLTPLATAITTNSYADTSAVAGTTYYYYVTALNGNLAPTNAESAASNEVSGAIASSSVKLTGAAIGVGGAYTPGSGVGAAFDGDLSTFFDPATGGLTNWVGLDLLSPQTITQIKFAPRTGYEFRMYGGQFQVSSTADFSSNVVTLYTVSSVPVSGQLTTISVNPGGTYRYVRFVGGTQWVNIAEMEVDGVAAAPPVSQPLSGAPIGVGGAYSVNSSVAAAFDGNLSTYFDPATGTLADWVGLDMQSAQTITQLKFAPRANYAYRMVGGQFQASNTADFASGVVTLYTIATAPVVGQLTSVLVSAPGTYRYVRYTGGTQWVNIAEMEVDGIPGTTPISGKLTGTAIGTAGFTSTSGVAQAFDGSTTTFFDAADSSLTDWVGLDLGTARTITQIKYAPRAGLEFRVYGGQFQVSNTADFSSGVVTIYTVPAIPVAGQLTSALVSVPGTFRYVRFTGGTQWVNIAEMEVDGY